jgi:voltage-gated potassium channel
VTSSSSSRRPRIVGIVVRKARAHVRRYVIAVTIPFVLVVAGTVGYHAIEGWSWIDAAYMTITTLTTVGFGEVHTLSSAGRVFTMVLMMGGVFTLFYSATELIRAVVSGEIQSLFGRQKMERMLSEIENHVIVCGYGRMGRLVCEQFSAAGVDFVVVDRQEPLLDRFALPHGIAVHGDATVDEVLRRAGVSRARALVTVAASDADNLYITMSARLLNEGLFIVARCDDEEAEKKLIRAGASRVILPYVIGGDRVAQAVLRPSAMDFIELATRSEHLELQIEETEVAAGGALAGKPLRDSGTRALGIIVVAVKKSDGRMLFNPDAEGILEPGDLLITLGPRPQLDTLARLARHGA